MRRCIRLILVWFAICCARLSGAAAEDFAATLELSSATAKLALTNAALPNLRQPEVRPVFHAKATENLTLHWTLTAKAEALHAVLAWASRAHVHPAYVDVRAPGAPAIGTASSLDASTGA